jgi:hypothetical protein
MKRKKIPVSSRKRPALIRNSILKGGLKAIPPGGPRGKRRTTASFEKREKRITRMIRIAPRKTKRGRSKPMLIAPLPPEPSAF